MKELKSQSDITGQWTNITDEMIEKAENEIVSGEDESDIEKEISIGGPDSTPDKQKEAGNDNPLEGKENVVEFKQKPQEESWRERLLKTIEEKQSN